jgi:hypothetical protein
MRQSVGTRRTSRRAVWILAGVAMLLGMLMVTAGTVAAAPSTPRTLTYHFTDCSGPAGTPATIDAVKQPGEAAALHLVDGSGVYVLMEAIDLETGDILFTTPGFDKNDLPTVTCRLIHPVTGELSLITGVIAPVR